MPEHQTFGQYQLAQTAEGAPLELFRTDDEVTCLAFDMDRQCFVEIHVFAEEESGGAGSDRERASDRGGRAKGPGVVDVAERLAEVRHPSVTRVLESGYDEGTPYVVTEFVDGESVARYLERTRPLPEPLALRLALDLAEGCAALAGQPLVLAGLDLFRARVVSEPGLHRHVRARVYNFGFGPGLRGMKEDPRTAETRCCLEVGRVLARAVDAPASIEKRKLRDVLSRIELGDEAKALLFDLLRGKCSRLDDLVVWLGSCLDEFERSAEAPAGGDAGFGAWGGGGARDDRESASEFEPTRVLREFVRRPEEAVFLAGSMESPTPGDAGPYSCAGMEPDLGIPCVFQLLPPTNLCGVSLVNGVRRAMDEIDPPRFPHLLSVFAVWEDDEKGDFFAEEPGAGMTVLEYARRRDGLDARGIVAILREVHAACTEAATAGFELWELSPQIECFHRDRTVEAASEPDHPTESDPVAGFDGLGVKVRVYPTLRHLAQPATFSPSGVARESATIDPDDFEAFIDFGIQLARLEANPLVRGSLARFLEAERERREKRRQAAARSPAQRREVLIERLAAHIADVRIDTLEEGAPEEDSLPEATLASVGDSEGPPGIMRHGGTTASDPEEFEDDASALPPAGSARRAVRPDPDDEQEVDEDAVPTPGLAQVLFGHDESPSEEWNPVARAIAGDDPDYGAAASDHDPLIVDRPPSLADRLFFWAVVVVVLILLGVAYFVAQMQGWLPESVPPAE